jgi:hypothetical protein
MQKYRTLVAALTLCAAHSAIAAADKPKVDFHSLAPEDSAGALRATGSEAKPAPVHTRMVATMLADGRIEMRCAEHHRHAPERPPVAERPR